MKKYLSLAVLAVVIIIIAYIWTHRYGVGLKPSPTPTPTTSESARTMYALNLTYEVDGELVSLVDGKATTPAGRGETITENFGAPVYGDMGLGKDSALMFLAQETPGTGVFFYVVATYPDVTGGYLGTNAVFIGDRIAPQNIRVINGVAEVNYADRKKGEPMSAEPSVGVTKYLVLKDGKLQEK